MSLRYVFQKRMFSKWLWWRRGWRRCGPTPVGGVCGWRTRFMWQARRRRYQDINGLPSTTIPNYSRNSKDFLEPSARKNPDPTSDVKDLYVCVFFTFVNQCKTTGMSLTKFSPLPFPRAEKNGCCDTQTWLYWQLQFSFWSGSCLQISQRMHTAAALAVCYVC